MRHGVTCSSRPIAGSTVEAWSSRFHRWVLTWAPPGQRAAL
jgi:hypothetical protein